MHTATVQNPDEISAIAAAMSPVQVSCEQNPDGTWSITVPDENAAQLDELVANPPGPSKAQLTSYALNARWSKENGGITFDGFGVATDDRSKLLILGSRISASSDATFTTAFQSPDNTVTTLNATQAIALSDAVLKHVNGCFSTYGTIMQGVTAGTIKTTADIDAAFAAMAV